MLVTDSSSLLLHGIMQARPGKLWFQCSYCPVEEKSVLVVSPLDCTRQVLTTAIADEIIILRMQQKPPQDQKGRG